MHLHQEAAMKLIPMQYTKQINKKERPVKQINKKKWTICAIVTAAIFEEGFVIWALSYHDIKYCFIVS